MKPVISPVPRRMEALPGAPLLLGRRGDVRCSLCLPGPLEAPAAHWAALLRQTLTEKIGAPLLPDGEGTVVALRLGDAPADAEYGEQGYELTIDAAGVWITGFGAAGLAYGIHTFLQCLETGGDGAVRAAPLHVLDWPEQRTRGHFMECRYGSNLMTLEDWKSLVDNMAGMKLNQLIVGVYGCWCVQYDRRISEYLYLPLHCYPQLTTPVVKRYYSPERHGWVDEEQLPPMVEEDFFGELIAYGRECGVEVLPLFNSFGHNTLIPRMLPQVSARDEDGAPTGHGFCLSCPDTYDVLFHIYDEIIDRYLAPNGIQSFHIGLDEVIGESATDTDDVYRSFDPWCRCEHCRGKTKSEHFAAHIVRIASHLKQRGIKNVYLYADMLFYPWDGSEPLGGMLRPMLEQNGLLDTVVLDWWDYPTFEKNMLFHSLQPEQGMRAIVKPWNGYYHWNGVFINAVPNQRLIEGVAHQDHAEGTSCYSAWDLSLDRNNRALAEFSWNYTGTGGDEEINRRYARLHFPSGPADGLRLLSLFDQIVEEPREEGRVNRRDLLWKLSYYPYSYVSSGEPYPRIFPGVAFSWMLQERETRLRELRQISALAAEGVALADRLAEDVRNDQPAARRLGCDFDSYRCLAEDYLAMDEIQRLCEANEFAPAAAMAARRKRDRLRVLDRLERTKEPFLHASHMRNQSIFLQSFADLETALENAEAGDTFSLCDLSACESEVFRRLR